MTDLTMALATVLAPYLALGCAWYAFVMYPVMWFRRHYRVRIVRRVPAHG